MLGPYNFDFESFKKELLKLIEDETRQMVRDMVVEIVGKMPFNKEDFETRSIVGEPFK